MLNQAVRMVDTLTMPALRIALLFLTVLAACSGSDGQSEGPEGQSEASAADIEEGTTTTIPAPTEDVWPDAWLGDGRRLCIDPDVVVYESVPCLQHAILGDFEPDLTDEDQARIDQLMAESEGDIELQIDNQQIIQGILNTYPGDGSDIHYCQVMQGVRPVRQSDFFTFERNREFVRSLHETICPGDLALLLD